MKKTRSPVTTKRGDAGETVTIAGDRLPKSHPILEACGQIDTLRALTALLRLNVIDSKRADADKVGESLLWLLHVYFLMGSQCNDPLNKHPEYRKQDVSAKHLDRLEAWQESIEAHVKLPKQFIVTASNTLAAETDIACTATRALERSLVRLKEAVPEFEAVQILAFVNRLSDTLFMLARHFESGEHNVLDYGVLHDTKE